MGNDFRKNLTQVFKLKHILEVKKDTHVTLNKKNQ